VNPAWIPAIVGAGMDFAGMLFGKHQADTAHQREVEDLKKAGIHPAMTAQSRGAPVPSVPQFSDSVSRGVSSGLAVQRQRAEIDVLESQAESNRAAARAAGQATDIAASRFPSEMHKLSTEIDIGMLNADALRARLPFIADQVRAEIAGSAASARHANVLSDLAELDRAGRLNESIFQERIGQFGPWSRVIAGAASKLGVGAVAGALLFKNRRLGKWSSADDAFVKGR